MSKLNDCSAGAMSANQLKETSHKTLGGFLKESSDFKPNEIPRNVSARQDFIVEMPHRLRINKAANEGCKSCASCQKAINVNSYLLKKSIGLLSEQKNEAEPTTQPTTLAKD